MKQARQPIDRMSSAREAHSITTAKNIAKNPPSVWLEPNRRLARANSRFGSSQHISSPLPAQSIHRADSFDCLSRLNALFEPTPVFPSPHSAASFARRVMLLLCMMVMCVGSALGQTWQDGTTYSGTILSPQYAKISAESSSVNLSKAIKGALSDLTIDNIYIRWDVYNKKTDSYIAFNQWNEPKMWLTNGKDQDFTTGNSDYRCYYKTWEDGLTLDDVLKATFSHSSSVSLEDCVLECFVSKDRTTGELGQYSFTVTKEPTFDLKAEVYFNATGKADDPFVKSLKTGRKSYVNSIVLKPDYYNEESNSITIPQPANWPTDTDVKDTKYIRWYVADKNGDFIEGSNSWLSVPTTPASMVTDASHGYYWHSATAQSAATFTMPTFNLGSAGNMEDYTVVAVLSSDEGTPEGAGEGTALTSELEYDAKYVFAFEKDFRGELTANAVTRKINISLPSTEWTSSDEFRVVLDPSGKTVKLLNGSGTEMATINNIDLYEDIKAAIASASDITSLTQTGDYYIRWFMESKEGMETYVENAIHRANSDGGVEFVDGVKLSKYWYQGLTGDAVNSLKVKLWRKNGGSDVIGDMTNYNLAFTISTHPFDTGDKNANNTINHEPDQLDVKYVFVFKNREFTADNIDDPSLKTIQKKLIYDPSVGFKTNLVSDDHWKDILTDLGVTETDLVNWYLRWYVADNDGNIVEDLKDWGFATTYNGNVTYTKNDTYGYYTMSGFAQYLMPNFDPTFTYPSTYSDSQKDYHNYKVVCLLTTDKSGMSPDGFTLPKDCEPSEMQVEYVFSFLSEEEYYSGFLGTLSTPHFKHSKEVLIPSGTTEVTLPLNESFNKILQEYDKTASQLGANFHIRWYVTKWNSSTNAYEKIDNSENYLTATSSSLNHIKVYNNGLYWNSETYTGTNPWSANPSYTTDDVKNLLNVKFTVPNAAEWEQYKVFVVMTDNLDGQEIVNGELYHEPDALNMLYTYSFFVESDFLFVHSKGASEREYVKVTDDSRLAGTVQQYSWNNDESEREKLTPNEDIRQGVHTYEYDLYVDNSSSADPVKLMLPLAKYGDGGNIIEPTSYIRWYDWTTDMASPLLNKVGSMLVTTEGKTEGTSEYKYSAAMMERGWFFVNNHQKGLQLDHAKVGVTFNSAGLSDIKYIACDVSKYYDGIYTGSTGEYMLHEPTLSERYIFRIHPASECADDIKGSLEDKNGELNFNAAVSAMASKESSYSDVKDNMFNLFEDNGRVVVSVKDENSVFVLRANLANLEDYYIYSGSSLVNGDNINWYSYYEDEKGLWVLSDNSNNPKSLTQLTAGDGLYFGELEQNKRISPFSLKSLSVSNSDENKYVLLSDNSQTKEELQAAPGQKYHLIGYIGNTSKGVSAPVCHYELRFVKAPAYRVTELPANRKDEYFDSHYDRAADPVNFDEYMNLDKPTSQVENFSQNPLPWEDAAYGYCYPSIDQYRIWTLDNDYIGLSPLHGDYTLLKSMNVTDGGVNISDGWGGEANTYVIGPNYSLHWWNQNSLYDYTHVYQSTYYGDDSKYGTFFYVDAADESRTMAILPFDAELCSGSEIHFTMAIADMTEDKPKLTPQVCAHVWEVDEHGNKLQQVISFLTCELNSVTNDGSKSGSTYFGQWWQVYGHGTLPTGIGLDGSKKHFIVEVDNYSRHTDGADYCIDQITFYTNSANVKVDQSNATCEDKLEMTVYMDAEMLKTTALQESDTPQPFYWRLVDEDGNVVTGNDVYSYYDEYGNLQTDDGSMTYGKAYITTNYKLDDEGNLLDTYKVAAGEHHSGFFKDEYEVVYFQLTKSQFPVVENKQYYIAIYDFEDGLTSTPDGKPGNWHTIEAPCGVVSKLFAPQKLRVALKDPLTGKATTTVAGPCGGGTTDVTLSVELQYPVPLTEDSRGYKVYDVHFDFFKGTKAEYLAVTNLKEALKDFRTWDKTTNSSYSDYSNASALETALSVYNTYKGGTEETPNEYYTALKSNMSNLMLAASVNSFVINGFSGTNGTTYNFVAVAIEDKTDDNKIICDELALSFKYETSGDGPILDLGFEDVSYPSSYVRVVRLGKEQMDNLKKTDGFLLHVPVNSFKTSSTATAKEGKLKVTSDLTLVKEGTTDGNVTANVDKIATFAETEISSSKMYISLNFHDAGVASCTFHEGFAYKVHFKYDVDGGEGGCDGDMNFILKIVPEFVTWEATTTGTNWCNDANWSRSQRGELYKSEDGTQNTASYAHEIYKDNSKITTDESLSSPLGQPKTYVPMKFTYVTLDEQAVAPNLINLQRDGTTGIYTNIGGSATPNIEYDMLVKYEVDGSGNLTSSCDHSVAKTYDCEKFYGNWCREIYFKPEAELINQQHLIYNKAWVEKELTPNSWTLMATPLRVTYAGDMYVPYSSGRQETEAFQDINFDAYDATTHPTGVNSRTKYPIYQRSWGDAFNFKVYVSTNENLSIRKNFYYAGLPYSSATESTFAEWGHTFNDVQVPYTTRTAFAVRALRKTQATKTLIRLPKQDTDYGYFNYNGVSENPAAGDDVKSVTKGTDYAKLLVDNSQNGDQLQLTLTNAQKVGEYYLVGNPYMASLDMATFITDNGNNIEGKYWTYENGSVTAATNGTIKPLQGFFVKAKENAEEIVFNPSQMTDGNQTRDNGARAAVAPALTLTATNGYGSSMARVELNETASDEYVSSEDVETLFDSNLSDVPMVFTTAGVAGSSRQMAVSIDVRPSLDVVPFGVTCAASNEQVEVTVNGEGERLYVVDAVTGEVTEMYDGKSIAVQPNDYGRYFLTTRSDLTAISQAMADGGIVVSVRGKQVTVRSQEPIESLRIVSTSGQTVYSSQPSTTEAAVQLPLGGIYIIEAEAGGQKRTVKAMVK